MSVLYTYICTKSTADPFIPSTAPSQAIFNRDVSDAFAALAGGHTVVGRLAFFPVQRSVPNHLLCDGSEVPRASFPELFDLLGNTQGSPVNGANFVLPNYIGTVEAAPTAVAQTVTEGTVSTPPPGGVTPAPTETPIYGDVDSGGRHYRGPEVIP